MWRQLEPRAWPHRGLSPVNKLLVVLILLATFSAIVETEPLVRARFGAMLTGLELVFGLAFLAEYLARLWSVPEDPRAGSAWGCRLRFIVSPMALVDLAAVLSALLPFLGLNAAMLRLLRLIRIARLAKLGRMSRAMEHISAAFRNTRDELILILALAGVIIIAAATLLFWLEGEVQPDKFGSVPRAMWWAIVTMTTIGYGDAYPITSGGKVAAAALAVAGVGLIALPAGLMAGALSQIMRGTRVERE